MRDIVFLFGAGASHGAGGILPERPPLGSGLYSELARLYPGSWGALPANVVLAFKDHFEDGMGEVHSQFGATIPQLMREMAVYFAQFRAVNNSCLYARLLADLAETGTLERTCFSSLNYDCVLDFAVIAAGLQLNYFETADDLRVPLWKLHGSCNMFAKDVQATAGVYYGTGVTFEGGVQAFLDSNRIIEYCLAETALAPVMSLYMRGKPLNVSPTAIASILKLWTQQVLEARLIVVAGVRPWPDDTHIWGPLATTDAPLLFVGNAAEVGAWAGASRRGSTEVIGARVNESYDNLIGRINDHDAD